MTEAGSGVRPSDQTGHVCQHEHLLSIAGRLGDAQIRTQGGERIVAVRIPRLW
jgi:hypothetical protein